MGRPELESAMSAMETPEKYERFAIAKNRLFTGRIDREKCENFARYTTRRFLDACRDASVWGDIQNWNTTTAEQKLGVAEKITTIFLRRIIDDIWHDRVQIYTHSGDEYHNTNAQIDSAFKHDFAVMPQLHFQARNIPGAVMGVARDGNFYIATDNVLYQSSPLFFLMDLKHELTHVIDMFLPNISPLGPEIRDDAQMYYINPMNRHADADLYKNNPLELNADMLRRDLRIQLQQMLDGPGMTMPRTNEINR